MDMKSGSQKIKREDQPPRRQGRQEKREKREESRIEKRKGARSELNHRLKVCFNKISLLLMYIIILYKL
jgi:hypothetical protein